MENLFNAQSLALFLSAIPIGIFAIVFGGSMFLSIPVFQMLFPEIAMGSVIGNIKIGSIIRNIGAAIHFKNKINLKPIWPLLTIFCAGSFIGAFSAAQFSQKYLLPAIIIAVIISEYGEKIEPYIHSSLFYLIVFLTGVFGGLIGAGILLFIIALLRVRIKDDHSIHQIRVLAILTELLISLAATLVFWKSDLLKINLWLPWTLGSMFGGWIGGIIILKSGKMPPKTQKLFLRAAFGVAIFISATKVL